MNTVVFLTIVTFATLLMSLFMYAAWLLEQRTGHAGWADTFWSFGLGFTGVTGSLAALMHSFSWRAILIAALAALWSMRLGTHILSRTLASKDDPRYAKMRVQWGPAAPAKMLQFLQIQAIVSLPLVMAIVLAAWNPLAEFRVQDFIGLLVLLTGIVGEGISDRQMRTFRANAANHGKICDTGLWRYSRHPNYFFEWMIWLAYPLFAIDAGSSYYWGWLSLAAPVCMYWLLTQVSGIPPLEDIMVDKYGERYRRYQRMTSAFFPGPPRAL